MILRLDPRHAILWRTPTSIQLGIDPPAVTLHDVTETQERLLAALAVGVSRPGLTMLARGKADEVEPLLAAVAPALALPDSPDVRTVAITGTEPLAGAIAQALAGSRVQVARTDDPTDLAVDPDFGVVVSRHVTPPVLHGLWLRRDVPHLAVVIGEHAVTVGPVVEPGSGPCLLCIELHRRDADPAWPALATQLLGREVTATPPALLLESAGLASRLVLAHLSGAPARAVATRVDTATGRRDETAWTQHPECGCRGVEALRPLEPVG